MGLPHMADYWHLLREPHWSLIVAAVSFNLYFEDDSLINAALLRIEAASLRLTSSFASFDAPIHPKMVPQFLSVGSLSMLAVLATFLNSGLTPFDAV